MANQESPQIPAAAWSSINKGEASQPSSTKIDHGAKTDGASLVQKTERVAEQAAGSAIEQVRSVRSGLTQQRDQVADRIRRVSNIMRDSADRASSEDEFAAQYFHMASDRIERVASYVGNADLATLAADTQEFVRKRPAVFFGGAFLVGLAVGRFLKATSGGVSLDGGYRTEPRGMNAYGQGSMSTAEPKRLPSEGVRPSSSSSVAASAFGVPPASGVQPTPSAQSTTNAQTTAFGANSASKPSYAPPMAPRPASSAPSGQVGPSSSTTGPEGQGGSRRS